MTSAYQRDISGQPDALRVLASSLDDTVVADLVRHPYDRVVITGMGTSHYAGYPTWRALVRAGRPAWWLDTAQLLDVVPLLTADTLVLATSQSGESGEVVALLDRLEGLPARLVAVTNDAGSALASAASASVIMQAGAEATVSTKSYLNSLVLHAWLTRLFLGGPPLGPQVALRLATRTERWLAEEAPLRVTALIDDLDRARVAIIGSGVQLATALTAALVLKEAAKVPAEAFVAGEFRHGPIELAGPGLAAVFVDDPQSTGNDLARLAGELRDTGARVVELGTSEDDRDDPDGDDAVAELSALVYPMLAFQRLSVDLAVAKGLTPGEFLFGRKVTSAV
jgi:glucosamine--fructose-6-phosphate aminotransferase (isomerizing)